MPEIKNTFTGGKMNKDLDERLVKNGEYKHALNIQVRTTDGDSEGIGDAGTVQNILGNKAVGSLSLQNWMNLTSDDVYALDGTLLSEGDVFMPRCVGSIPDEKNNNAYFFFGTASPKGDFSTWNYDEDLRCYSDVILQQSNTHLAQGSQVTTPVVVDVWDVRARVSAHIPGVGQGQNTPYQNTGWSEIDVSEELASKLRPEMSMKIVDNNGNSTINNATIKAIDGTTLLFEELFFITLTPNTAAYVIFSADRVLNFPSSGDLFNITGINIIDDLLMWTDGSTEPKKVHISRSIAGTNIGGVINSGTKHTKLYLNNPDGPGYVDANTLHSNLDNGGLSNGSGVNSYLKEEHLTVLRRSPKLPPTLEMSHVDRPGITDTSATYSFTNGQAESDMNVIAVGDIREIDLDTSNTNYRPNDILVFTSTNSLGDVNYKAKFIAYVSNTGEQVLTSTGTILVEMVTVIEDPNVQNTWNVSLEARKPLFELKLVRFGYRYKYNDGEYSSFSPWSELAFLPDEFDYKISKAYNLGMVNTVRQLIIKDFIPYNIPLDVVSVDILYKTTDSPNVYIAETVDISTPQWDNFTPNGEDDVDIQTGRLSITSEMIHRILPENQVTRAWDNVPRYANAQEVVGNRLVFGNYVQGYNLSSKLNLIQSVNSDNIEANEATQPPHKSLKSIRDYKIGMVFGDKYGRETPVISPGYILNSDDEENTIDSIVDGLNVDKTLCANANSFLVQQNWEENSSPDSWIDYVRYYVKETSNEYYNLVMDRWYDSGDNTVWLSFNSADRNKVDEETYLILKNKFGSHEPVLQKARYKIIAIENEAPDFIKTEYNDLGILGEVTDADAGDGAGGLDTVDGDDDYVLDVWPTATNAENAAPNGWINGTSFRIAATKWDAVFNSTDEHIWGQEIEGNLEMRIVGKSWNGDTSPNTNLYTQKTAWKRLTNVRKTDNGTFVEVSYVSAFGAECDFFNIWTNSATSGYPIDVNNNPLNVAELIYEIEFRQGIVKNRPEFDGKFFVKIEADEVLRSNVLVVGGPGYDWSNQGTFQLSYISSTTQNEAIEGPRKDDVAVFDQAAIIASSASDRWFNNHFRTITNYGYNGSSWVNGTGPWSGLDDINFFEEGVLPYCGDGNHFSDQGQYSGTNMTTEHGMVWSTGFPRDFPGAGSTNWPYPNCCTSIKPDGQGLFSYLSYEEGGSLDTGGVYSNLVDYNPGGNGSLYAAGGYGFDSDTGYSNPDNWQSIENSGVLNMNASQEFNEAANYGVFASCTWGHNYMTAEFWQSYGGINKGQTTGDNLAFIDGAKARHFNWGLVTDQTGADYQPESPNFYRPKSIGGEQPNGTFNEMTISRLHDATGDLETSTAEVLMDLLDDPGNAHFRIGNDPNIYKVYQVIKPQADPRNFSQGSTKGYKLDINYDGAEVWYDPRFIENCRACGDGLPYTHPEQQVGNIVDASTWNDDGSWYNGFYFDQTNGCKRKSMLIRFTRVNPSNGVELTDENNNPIGFDISEDGYDPRGHVYHDGRSGSSLDITILYPRIVSYGDDSPINDLGACWETEPKDDFDLDLYYEASGSIPMKLNKENVFNFAPINSKVSIQRVQDGVLKEYALHPGRKDHKVANIDMASNNDTAILTIVSHMPGDNINPKFRLHNGPFDIEGAYDPNPQAYTEFDIMPNDIIVFTHANGTKTRSKVTSYYEPIDDSVNGAFNNLDDSDDGNDDSDSGPMTGIGVTSGPKAFRATSVNAGPTGFYGIEIDVWNNEVQLPWFNCYSFGNGVESDRIRDDFNAPQIDNGVKVSTTFSGYQQERIKSGIIYSGIYNSTSQVNDLNEFNMAEKITKELNPRYGSIQRFKTRDTDMVVFTEDKVLRLLANKDAVFNADGNPQLVASNRVLGTPVPYAGDYGISKNPESLAWDQFRMYFTDKQRGAVLRLSKDGLTPISNVGMKSWFRKNLPTTSRAVGSFDVVNGEYNLSLRMVGRSNQITVSFNEASKGWVSFKSFVADTGLSISGQYYTAFENKIWRHHDTSVDRNDFYGKGTVNSMITMLFNEMPSVVKSFKAISYEGSQARIIPFLGESLVAYTGNPIYAPDYLDIPPFAGFGQGMLSLLLGSDYDPDENNDGVPDWMEPYVNPDAGQIIGSETSIVSVTDNEYYNITGQPGWYCSEIKTDLEKANIVAFKNKENKWFSEITGKEVAINEDYINTDQFTVQGIGQVSGVQYLEVNPPEGEDCIPPCPSDYVCVNGICEEFTVSIYGCTDPNDANYNPSANVDDGSCVGTVYGCMDFMAPNYDPLAIETNDTENCQPLCTDCVPYVYGCMDETAYNYNPIATTDGYCYFNGQIVPCPPSQVLDENSPNYNGNQWANPFTIGLVDNFVPTYQASCLYETGCPEGQLFSTLLGCVDVVLGCTDPGFVEYNPEATVDDGSCSIGVGTVVYGCTDPLACNYFQYATVNNNSCEYFTCVGCMTPGAINYNEILVNNGTITQPCDDCCLFEELTVQDVPGCTQEGYEFYDSSATVMCINQSFSECCGEILPDLTEEVPIYGCMDNGDSLPDNVEVTNYNINATSQETNGVFDPTLCQYSICGCTDPEAFNYDIEWVGSLPSNYTVVDCDSTPCEDVVVGCMDETMYNYDSNANTPGDCTPYYYGCMDPGAINYNPFANTDTAGFNPSSNMKYVEQNGLIILTQGSSYDGNCLYWVYGCMDPTALNYAGPNNQFGCQGCGEDGENIPLEPHANTQYIQSYEIGFQENWENPDIPSPPISWTPGYTVTLGEISTGEAVECETCGCEYIGDGNLQLQVRNYPGDSEATEEDVDYNDYSEGGAPEGGYFDDTEG